MAQKRGIACLDLEHSARLPSWSTAGKAEDPEFPGVQGCIKLAIRPKPGRGVSPKRRCFDGNGRPDEASLPELDAARPGVGHEKDQTGMASR